MKAQDAHRPFRAERRAVDPGHAVAYGGGEVSNADVLAAVESLRAALLDSSGRPKAPEAPAAQKVAHVIGDQDMTDLKIELAQMIRMIARAKREISQIKHPMSDDDRVTAASSELDAIVRATETATQDILDATETIEEKVNAIQAIARDDEDIMTHSEGIAAATVTILEACNFQDITGQRITKVVKTLRFIEERILAMINIWGVDAFAELPVPASEVEGDAALLEGPQLANQGISQEEIDALFD